MFNKIYFISEYIKDYSSIVALFLSNTNKLFSIISEKEVTTDMIIGFTYFSMNSMVELKQLRKRFPNNTIIVGGCGVPGAYHRILQVADYVYFGQAFNFKEESVLSHKFEKTEVTLNEEVPYNLLPLIHIGKNNYYMLIETGCPYNCEYCYVSAINKFSKISTDSFESKIANIDQKLKAKHIALIGNEGIVKEKCHDLFEKYTNNQYDNQSITILTYLKNYEMYRKQQIIRFGIELPTEELRFKILPKFKHIKDTDILEVLTEKYNIYKCMQFFYIYNYLGTTVADYDKIFDIVSKKEPSLLLRLSFTTLEIQPYTKLIPKLSDHIEQLLSSSDFKDIESLKKLHNISRIKIFQPKRNSEVIKNYLYSYSNLPLTSKINDKVIQIIIDNSQNIQKIGNKIKINDFNS